MKQTNNRKNPSFLPSFLLVVAMILALLPAAFAEDNAGQENTTPTTNNTFTLTIKGKNDTAIDPNRKFEIYQIFTGDVSTNANGKEVLTNAQYGSSWSDKFGAVIFNESDINTSLWMYDFSIDAAMVDFLTSHKGAPYKASADLELTADGYYVINDVPGGYYMVVEVTENDNIPAGQTRSTYVISMTNGLTMYLKDETASFEKKVADINDSKSATQGDWQDSADYDIGDHVPFLLKATVAGDFDKYGVQYDLIFHDTLSAGLTFDGEELLTVKINDTQIPKELYTVKTPGMEDGCSFEVELDLKEIVGHYSKQEKFGFVKPGSKVTVEYTATLNPNAVIGSAGNENTGYIEFSNNPYEYHDHGKTPEDKVIVFTYQLDVNKVDKDSKALKGAAFTLYKKLPSTDSNQENWTEIKKYTVSENENSQLTTFSFVGLDDGTYKLVETTVPEGYNKAEDIIFEIEATHTNDPQKLSLGSLVCTSDGGATFSVEESSGSCTGVISTDVVNKAGNTLPSTGGMGTTIFYVFGTVLALGAAVLLIAKKRVSR